MHKIKNFHRELLKIVDFFFFSPLEPAVLYLGGGYQLHVVHSPGAWQGCAAIKNQAIQQITAAYNLILCYVQDSDIWADISCHPRVLLSCLHHILPTHNFLVHSPLYSSTNAID